VETRIITGDAVRHALRAVRFAKPLGDSPLLELDALAAWLARRGEASTHTGRETGLALYLEEVIWDRLRELRGARPSPRRASLAPEVELSLLREDFQAGKTEIEAWSLLYHRYLAHDRTPVGQVADLLGITDKTLERRLDRGHTLLAARLRDLEAEAPPAQAHVRSSAGPIATPVDRPASPPPLPLPLTGFVGRAADLDTLHRLVAEHRLVTLTGPGGIGKTRLALEVGRIVAEEIPGGVWLVELAAVAEDAQVARTVAQALGVQENAGQPLVDALAEHLRAPARLVILDNCEQVREACGRLVAALLARCEALHVLATSREPLHLVGEQLWPVAPLALPDEARDRDPMGVADTEAVALFAARAREALPGFALTPENLATAARICTRLDGIPLALELAAARVRALDLAEIDRRLDQRFRLLTRGAAPAAARHQTLKAAIDWGYELLDEDERALLRRLAVFRGGWTVEAAEAVCNGGLDAVSAVGERGASDSPDVLDTLSDLVDKSFVVPTRTGEGGRFRMLETIRAYAWDRLTASGEDRPVRDRHLAWCATLAEAAEPELQGAHQAVWLDRLDAESDNLRAALAWSAEGSAEHGGDNHGTRDGNSAGLRLGAALGRYWLMRGSLTEGREQLGKLLAANATMPSASRASAARAKALAGAGTLARQQCDFGEALRLYEEGLSIEREAGNDAGVAGLLRSMGNVSEERGEHERARMLYEESLALFRRIGDTWGTAAALNNLGILDNHLGAPQSARPLLEESLALFRGLDELWAVGVTLFNLGHGHFDQDDLEAAEGCYRQSLEVARDLGDLEGIASGLSGIGNVALRRADYAAARRAYLESIEVLADLGDRQAIAECLEALAAVDRTEGDAELAVRRIGAADALRDAIGSPVPPHRRAEWDAQVAALKAALGEAAFAARWAEGRGMGWRGVVG